MLLSNVALFLENLIPQYYEDFDKTKYCDCSNCVKDFWWIFKQCRFGPKLTEITTTTSDYLGGFFGTNYDYMLEQEYLNTVEDLIEMSRINANEMLTSYHLGSIIKSSIFTDMEEDWIPFIHPNYGWCHTFDPKDLVPMRMDFQSSGEQNGLIYLEMMFDVSVFNFHALEHLLTSHDTF